jgi:hypothetical protein
MKTFCKDLLSNTSLKAINSNKYNVFIPEKPYVDFTLLYEKRKDGWRRKIR